MADPTLVLLIVVGLTAADRPQGSVVSTAVGSGLGTDARILVEERASAPTDEEAASTASRIGGSAVAEIAWADAAHGRAHLHVYLASDRAWYDQELSFDALDAPEDRERSIGLLVGAMIRARQAEADAAAAPPDSSAAPAAPPPITEPAPTLVVPPRAAEQPAVGPAASPPRSWRFGIDVGGLGTAGIGGEAQGLGPAFRARVLFGNALSVHGGVAFGFGSLHDAGADMTTTRLALGGRYRFARLAGGVVGLDGGLEGLAVHHVVRRTAPDASRERWLSGGHVDVGAGFVLMPALELYTTLGMDVVAGATPITLAGQRVAEIPPVRGTLEVGARLFF